MLPTIAVCDVGFFITRKEDFVVNELVDTDRSCSEDLNRRGLDQAFTDRQFGPAAKVWEPRALRVLVIEDDADTAESMARLVKLWGHDVRQEASAQAGLNEAFSYRPDFVLLDIGMPTTDGCSVARQLRLDPRLQGCFIVAITGYGDAEQRRRCYAAGINVFLVKPVDHVVLERLLNLEGGLVVDP
jgi:CheY-like chemotaxis protein